MVTTNTIIEKAVSLASQSFYHYCALRWPSFYKPDREYLRTICDTLQALVEDRLANESGKHITRLIINMPPRHGKTRTLVNFCQWYLGRNARNGIITASYNELLSSRFARDVRDNIQEEKAQGNKLVYSDFFPGVEIKKGDASAQFWSLTGSHFSYLATSPGGTMTGIGANLLIIDDLLKNAYEAQNARVLEEQWTWYCNTALSRLEARSYQIVTQTRWATGDLSGRLIESEPDQWGVLCEPAHDEQSGAMLCPEILSLDAYRDKQTKLDPVIFQSNYQQKPFDAVDRLYPTFRTYRDLPSGAPVHSYTDTADRGEDYLCSIVYAVYDGCAYVKDILYTQEGMDKTEGDTADMLIRNGAAEAWVESNNGGESFARNISRLIISRMYTQCNVRPFHQSANKVARILSNATSVCNCVIMPEDWVRMFPAFHRDISRMARAGRWLHDDAADALTGIVEKSLTKTFAFAL